MTEGNCQRCDWPYGKTAESGCAPGKCQCTCAVYPNCRCGTFDKEKPDAAISVPRGTVAPVAVTGAVEIIEVPSPEKTFVMLHQPKGERAKVIYLGNDRGAAFDALMAMSEDVILSDIVVETQKT